MGVAPGGVAVPPPPTLKIPVGGGRNTYPEDKCHLKGHVDLLEQHNCSAVPSPVISKEAEEVMRHPDLGVVLCASEEGMSWRLCRWQG